MTTEDGQKSQGTRVVQVTNVAITAAYEQLKTFFEFLGEIEELKLFPSEDITGYSSKVCYIKYKDESSVHIAQHLTNTVFIDRALIVVPLGDGIIPEEHQALQLFTTPSAVVGSYGRLMPAIPGIVQTVIGSVMPVVRMQNTVPQPPDLPDVEPAKVDEIRRTVHISRLPKDITAEQLMSFFFACGEIRYVRIVGEEDVNNRYAFIEFNEGSCVARALQYNGAFFGGIPLKVGYSKHAIVKPEKELARTRKLDKTMRRVTEASRIVTEELDDDNPKSRKSSPSRSPPRRRSRSRSPRRKSRSKSSDRYNRQRRRSISPRYRDRGRPKSRSRSKDRKRRRSPSPRRAKDIPRRRSRSRDRKDKAKESSRKRSDKKDETKSPEKKREDDAGKEKEEEKKDETSKKKDEKPPRDKSRSRSRSQQRDKKKSRDKSGSRSTSRSPKRSSSKHKRKREKRDKSGRGSDDEYDKKNKKESDNEEKGYRSDDSGDNKKSRRRRGDDPAAGGRGDSDGDESKRKKRHYKKKPISADQYDSGGD